MELVCSMTWIDSPSIERELLNLFVQVEEDFRQDLKTEIESNEERLTGMLVAHFVHWGQYFSNKIQQKVRPRKGWFLRIDYEDMSKKRREAKFGTDMAFILNVKVRDVLVREKAILVQCKKSNTKSWPFDEEQAKNLHKTTTSGYYFIYLHPETRIGFGSYFHPEINLRPSLYNRFSGIAPISVAQAMGLKKATKFKTVIPLEMTAPSSKSFPDFMLYDFIGCWAGENLDGHLRNVIFEEKPPRHIIKIGISTEEFYHYGDRTYE